MQGVWLTIGTEMTNNKVIVSVLPVNYPFNPNNILTALSPTGIDPMFGSIENDVPLTHVAVQKNSKKGKLPQI